MERFEIERMLLDERQAKELSDTARRLKERLDGGSLSTRPRSRIQRVSTSPSSLKATPQQIDANDRTNIQRRSMLADIGKVLPELGELSAQEALEALTRRYSSQPTEPNSYLIQDAINRLTHVGELNEHEKTLVSNAIDALTTVNRPDQPPTADNDSVYSAFYQHSDFKGRSIFAYLGPDSTYASIRKSTLDSVDLNDSISSLRLDATAGEVRGDVLLFQDDRFFGRFTQIRAQGGSTTSATYVGTHINDRTSSILLVHRTAEEVFQPLGNPISTALIRNMVAEIEGIRNLRGDPIFTWDMWPTGGDNHPNDPDKRLVQIKVPIRVDVPNWFDYDAEIWLWIYMYIGYSFPAAQTLAPGALRGYVSHYGAWVEAGVKSEDVLDAVMAGIESMLGDFDALISAQLSIVNNAGPFSTVYLLPGDQTSFSGAALESHVADNVTVVLTKASDPVLAPPESVVGLV
jgi:hypothetical protein